MSDTFQGISLDQRLIQKLAFLMAHIRYQQRKENMEALDLRRQFRAFCPLIAVQTDICFLVGLSYLHDIDTMMRRRRNLDKLTVNVMAGSTKLVTFQRCQNKDLHIFLTQTHCHQL